MKSIRRLLPFVIILIALTAGWIWWSRPKKVDMSAFVPADALLYLEVNDVPLVLKGLTSTDGWKTLAEPAGIKPGLGSLGWLGRLAAWTGIGRADTIVYSRMQIAATVLGVGAADGGETLNVKPRVAVVVETHTSASRTLFTIEKHVGNFAQHAYVNPRVESKEIEGTKWIIWSSPSDDRRIIAAITGSVAIVGNDEKAVQACLAVRRGERPSLMGNPELENARLRVPQNDTLASGFISSQGATVLSELLAAIYVGQLSEESRDQNLAANLIPQVAKKTLGSVGWSTSLSNGGIEDAYYFSTVNDAGARLRAALKLASTRNAPAYGLLPFNTYSVTRYETRDALAAWRGLNFSLTSQLDPVLGILISRFLQASLTPYGIEDSDLFLHAIGPEIVTARIESGGRSTVLIVEAKDEKLLRALVLKRLGAGGPKLELVGNAELMTSKENGRGAASFINGYLIMGPAESVRTCIDANQRGETLAKSLDSGTSRGTTSVAGPHVLTMTKDTVPAREFIIFVANQPAARASAVDPKELENRLNQLSYAESEMSFVEGGIERKTKSTFGLFGALAAQFNTQK